MASIGSIRGKDLANVDRLGTMDKQRDHSATWAPPGGLELHNDYTHPVCHGSPAVGVSRGRPERLVRKVTLLDYGRANPV
ncbi:unnamed protein product [Aspergillus oryzae]|uniref:Unnamed protein product n=2 Tax=Aspergillus oryzae TaxID=5062 RepID=A0AAN4YPD9_ASPOZ|nr:unnamed protein product [Aspergillus oryzae]GMF96814.1 unnamed protein product [Aspergillus oryzae]GMG30452.1 unnamed protein product [Aspergillus oryzae]GMG52824.1 unnamed protein product [Aspergillus oryzae var. brunneus]